MQETLSNWIVTIVFGAVLIVIADLVMPDGKIKKYTKLVTGLIIIVIIVNPIVKFINSGFSIENKIEDYISSIDHNIESYASIESTTNNSIYTLFKKNLEESIELDVLDYFKSGSANVYVGIDESSNELDYIINSVHIDYKEKKIQDIKPVIIDLSNENFNNPDTLKFNKLINKLSTKYNISSDKFAFNYIDN